MHAPDCDCARCNPALECTRCGGTQHGGLSDPANELCDACLADARTARIAAAIDARVAFESLPANASGLAAARAYARWTAAAAELATDAEFAEVAAAVRVRRAA